MARQEFGIEHKRVAPMQVACIRFNLQERRQVRAVLEEIEAALPAGTIAGAPYLHTQFFSSYTQGFEAEAGFPVHRAVEAERVKSKALPALEVLALTHKGPPEALRETRLKLYEFTRQHALISDEFTRETYPAWPDPDGPVEVHFVIHDWNARLAAGLERALGSEGREAVMQEAGALGIDSTPEARFALARAAMQRLDSLAGEGEKFEIVSDCAHRFPPSLLEKLTAVYARARLEGCDGLQAVDAVLTFMETDPAWKEKQHRREGRTIYQTKQPADPEAFAAAKTDAERRAAACFCPVIRARLDQGMPVTYCYCGAGWFRQQWEAATGRPVTVEVIRSVLKGDAACEFATHLPEDL